MLRIKSRSCQALPHVTGCQGFKAPCVTPTQIASTTMVSTTGDNISLKDGNSNNDQWQLMTTDWCSWIVKISLSVTRRLVSNSIQRWRVEMSPNKDMPIRHGLVDIFWRLLLWMSSYNKLHSDQHRIEIFKWCDFDRSLFKTGQESI